MVLLGDDFVCAWWGPPAPCPACSVLWPPHRRPLPPASFFRADATVDLATLLRNSTISAAVEMTLPGTQPLAAVAPTTYTPLGAAPVTVPRLPPPPAGPALTVTLKPQQIRTFECTLV